MRMSKHVEREYVAFMIVVIVLILLSASLLVGEVEGPGHPVGFETILHGSLCNDDYYDYNHTGGYLVIRNGTS